MDFLNKNVLVCGVAKSGISASLLLKKLGANVTIQDIKKDIPLEDLHIFKKEGINVYLGENPTKELIDTFDALILSPGISDDLAFVQYAKTKVPVLSEIELAYINCKAKIIAITGTNGKTTTTTLMGKIAKKFNEKTEVVGNIGVPFTKKVLELKKDGLFVAELSSFQLENIDTFRPKVSAVLNITPDHLNRHKTLENYIEAKEKIFKNQTNEDFLVLNHNDKVCLDMQKRSKANVLYFSSEVTQNEDVLVFLKDDYIYTNFNKKTEKFININEIKLLGKHNVENIMACVLMAYAIDIPMYIAKEVIKGFSAVEHRNEYVATIKDVDYYNDSKGTNPDSSIKAIESMKKKIVLIAGGYDKNSDFSSLVKSFKDKVKKLILIGDCKHKIAKFCEMENFFEYEILDTLEEAVKTSYENAKEGECVLFSPACASFDMFKDYEERGNLFKTYVFDLRGETGND